MAFPAMSSIMPQLVPREQLQQANALNSLLRGSLNILGPTMGALLVVTVGAGWALMVDALTWFVAALLLLGVRIPRPAGQDRRAPERHRRAAGGLELLPHGPRGCGWSWSPSASSTPSTAVPSSPWARRSRKETFGEQGWGLVLSAESAGLVLMTIVMLRVPLQRPLLLGHAGHVRRSACRSSCWARDPQLRAA